MRIELAGLELTEGKFTHVYEPGELILDDDRVVSLLEPPGISGRISQVGRETRIDGRITARVEVECDRCLKLIQLPVDSKVRLQYITAEDYEAFPVAELKEDELQLSVFDGAAIDIDEIVREQVLLAVPSHLLCQESCKGFCPICGEDKNLNECGCEALKNDPRWAALEGLVRE